MPTLIKNATIVDKHSPYHGKKVDLLIAKGKIEKVAKSIKAGAKDKVIKAKDLHISPGWIDIGTHLGEPGLEHQETISTACAAAKSGGYTKLAPFPNTQPPVQTKSSINYLLSEGKANGINMLPIAAMSQDLKGQDLTEMLDLHNAGCVAFSDGLQGTENAGLLLRALQYNKRISAAVIQQPHDQHVVEAGLMHEGTQSTMLGMKGSPSMVEYTRVKRDLDINQYVDATLTFHCLSTAESVKAIKSARKVQNVNATVSYLNLLKVDKDLATFDTNLKVHPPLRSKSDRSALIKGIKEGVITAIVSNHQPLDIEAKDLEFPYAKDGATGLETVFSALMSGNTGLAIEQVIECLTYGPAAILNQQINPIDIGSTVEVTLFSPTEQWEYQKTKSKSKNSPFLGTNMTGQVVTTL